jgi:TetR/AcrR family transcriptional regulator, transcriptional repressor for nem operon
MAVSTTSTAENTRDRLLASAIELVQQRGFHGISYADLAAAVGIRTASIHYHFPAKSDLGRAILQRHREENAAFFLRLESESERHRERLRNYFRAFSQCYGDGANMCLAGIMGIDAPHLDDATAAEVRECYADHERWLAGELEAGRRAGEFQFDEPPARLAKVLFDSLEGALLASRVFRDPKRLDASLRFLTAKLLG